MLDQQAPTAGVPERTCPRQADLPSVMRLIHLLLKRQDQLHATQQELRAALGLVG